LLPALDLCHGLRYELLHGYCGYRGWAITLVKIQIELQFRRGLLGTSCSCRAREIVIPLKIEITEFRRQ
jgi:hypothetical protein